MNIEDAIAYANESRKLQEKFTTDKAFILLTDEISHLRKIKAAAKLVVEDAGLGEGDYLVSLEPFEALEELLK
jgi:CTP-dependent riboflavin kinase